MKSSYMLFQVIEKKEKRAVYINSMGEQQYEMDAILAKLLSMRHFRETADTWRIETTAHSRQQDATSCGIFVIKVIKFHILKF